MPELKNRDFRANKDIQVLIIVRFILRRLNLSILLLNILTQIYLPWSRDAAFVNTKVHVKLIN